VPDAAHALRVAARFGPYFAWEPWDGDPRWRPLTDLLDEQVAAERVAVARQTLMRMFDLRTGEVPERVVASITFLGLASRLLSPPLAALAAGGVLPLADATRLRWRPVASGPVPMAYHDLAGAESPDRFTPVVIGLVEPVLAVFRRRFALSDHVLWGNVASALAAAAGMIADAVPDATPGAAPGGEAERGAALVAAALDRPPLRGMATLHRPDPARSRSFLVRRNCCLYYRLPGGGTCGDCVLTPEQDRHRQWRAVLSR
jgi:FhuF-like iron-sulfur protein